jgi:hypothetical protein
MIHSQVLTDVCVLPDEILIDPARSNEDQSLRQHRVLLLGDPAQGRLTRLIRSDQLGALDGGAAVEEVAEPAAFAPGQLPLDRAFHIFLADPQLRRLVRAVLWPSGGRQCPPARRLLYSCLLAAGSGHERGRLRANLRSGN